MDRRFGLTVMHSSLLGIVSHRPLSSAYPSDYGPLTLSVLLQLAGFLSSCASWHELLLQFELTCLNLTFLSASFLPCILRCNVLEIALPVLPLLIGSLLPL